MIIVGDVHGCLKTLKALLAKAPADDVCFVGDLIDRGPKSVETVQYVMDNGWATCLGNHEHMFLHWLGIEGRFGDRVPPVDRYDYRQKDIWQQNGGDPTWEFTQAQIDWIAAMPLYLEYPDLKTAKGRHLFVSHAAIMPSPPKYLPYSHDASLANAISPNKPMADRIFWYRGRPEKDPTRFYVFGHTPEVRPSVFERYAMIDTGCVYYKRSKKLKMLTALQFPSMQLFSQENIDMENERDDDVFDTED